MNSAWNLRGFDAVFYKELRQMLRSPVTLILAILVPMIQLFMLGYAVNTTVEHVPAAVYDGDRGAAAQAFVDAIGASRTFDVVVRVPNRKALGETIVSGRARVAFDIPRNFSADLVLGRRPAIGALVDGSDSAVAQVAYGAAAALSGVPLRGTSPQGVPAFEVRPIVLFNPGMRSANFFVPGLIGLIMQNITVMLTALAIVGERERGTLDQLLVTPIGAAGLMLGKLIPYALLAGVDFFAVLFTMRVVFGVPIVGSLILLVLLSAGFLIAALGLGLFISTIAQTQVQAQLLAVFTLLPSVILGGVIFERSLMPWPLQIIAYGIPLTYYVDILRGIILRGAGLAELWPSALTMLVYAFAVFVFASYRFARSTR